MKYGLNRPKTKPDFNVGTHQKQTANQEENQVKHVVPRAEGIQTGIDLFGCIGERKSG